MLWQPELLEILNFYVCKVTLLFSIHFTNNPRMFANFGDKGEISKNKIKFALI